VERKEDWKETVVIGCGGIFYRLVTILAENSAYMKDAPKRVALMDGDKFEEKNILRQGITPNDVGRHKVDFWSERVKRRFPDLNVRAIPEFLVPGNVKDIIQDRSLVILAVDNHATRLLTSRRCQELSDVILISGGNELRDGNVQRYVRLGGRSRTAPIEDVHLEIREPKDKNPGELSCEARLALPGGEQQAETNMAVALYTAWFFRDTVELLTNPERMKEAEAGKVLAEVSFDLTDCSSLGAKRGAMMEVGTHR